MANYRGTFPDGREFDSSVKQGKPMEVKVDSLITCLDEGFQKMKTGGKARMVCPPEIAYGDDGAGDVIPPGATLVFEVELIEVRN
jgi:FKBP-type peptidyl-prolyl cis-trans isomerase FkpA